MRGADEIWLSSSTKEVLAVTTLDGKPVGNGKPGPVFRRMHALYQEHKAKLAARRRRGLSRACSPTCRHDPNDDPPAESRSLLTFPCVFPIKVMGRREDGFAQAVVRHRAAPRARLPSRHDRDAHLEERAATSRSR